MRLVVYIITLAFVTYVFLVFRSQTITPSSPLVTAPAPSTVPLKTFVTDSLNHRFQYVVHNVNDPQQLRLITNYQASLPSKEIITAQNCSFSVNGGFYQTDRRPLGWLNQDGQQLSAAHESTIHNAYFSVSPSGVLISQTPPSLTKGFGFQSGPQLIQSSLPLSVNIEPDESRRRIIAALAANDQLYFIAVFDPNTPFGGPTLKELPQLLMTLQQKEQLDLKNALNLDGGSASVFYEASGIYLQELYPVGSLLCQ